MIIAASTAHRIKARAIRRVGELYNEIEPAKTGPKLQEGDLPQLGRAAVADAAGLSEHQRKTALRVALPPRPGGTENV